MVASAVLCAAVGTGMTLFVGITVVVYRYYSLRRQVHEWGSLDKMPFLENSPHRKGRKPLYTISQKVIFLLCFFMYLSTSNSATKILCS